MSNAVKIIGILIIVGSFFFILRRPDQSLMDTLMKKRKEDMEKLKRKTEETRDEDSEDEGDLF